MFFITFAFFFYKCFYTFFEAYEVFQKYYLNIKTVLSDHIFRAYDIRGIYGEDFNEEGAKLLGMAYATYMRKKFTHRDAFTISVGRDGRKSGELLQKSLVEGLREGGMHVVLQGELPSPQLYFSVCAGGYDGGIMITASHNPAKYNGFKLQGAGASSICGEEIQKILEIIKSKAFLPADSKGSLSTENYDEQYFELLGQITNFKKTSWRIAIDAGNGITGPFAPKFFRSQGFEVIELYCDVDGSFPNHEADPERAENLEDLKKLVMEEQCGFGLAFDGDGDRVGVVDRNGNHFSADLLLLLLARKILKENEGAAIVYDLKATELLKEEIESLGGKPVMCKTGHSFVEEKMEETGALLGGEVSGHIFIADQYFGYDDALLAAAKLLEIAVESEETFTDIFASLPKTFVTPEEKVGVSEKKKFEIMDAIVSDLQKKYPESLTIDGIRIDFGEGAWGIVRASNTSPYLTTRFEARSEEKLHEIQKIIMDTVQKHT